MGLFDNDLPCVKTPSKCIIWTGGKVYCIDVCEGDTIEDIIKKIGKKLKELYQSINIENLDFGDLLGEKECPPSKLIDVIQLIINKINECCSQGVVVTSDNSNLTVAVAECFQELLGVDVMDIVQYTQFLGNKICSQDEQLALLQEAYNTLNETVLTLQGQVEALIG